MGAAMADYTGQQFGNYRLTGVLGQGGFARVYLGTHLHLGTEVAIKVLQGALLTAGDIEKFRQEAQIIANLAHPNIVRVLDFGVQDGVPYLVMDYAPNGSLRTHLPQNTPLPPERIFPFLRQVADALQYAHDHKLIHRDIKPENMLLGRLNDVLLSDFGVALIAQTSMQQSTQNIVGTAPYIAPEQWQGHPHPASDQYALGVVVYEWLCGERPFNGGFLEVASQHVTTPPPSLRARVPGLSPDIEQAVFIALAKDLKQRFGSVSAFATAFGQACRSGVTLSPGVAYPTAPAPAPVGPTPPDLTQAPTVVSQGQTPTPAGFSPAMLAAPTMLTPSPYPPVPGIAPAGQTPTQGTYTPTAAQPFAPGQAPAGLQPTASGFQQYTAPQAAYPSVSPAMAPTFTSAQVPGVLAPPSSPSAPPEKRRSPALRVALFGLALLVIAGGVLGGLLLTGKLSLAPGSNSSGSQIPTLEVKSAYMQGTTPVGAAGTTFQISGQQFASNSRITFLLDGQAAPDAPEAQSTASGAVSVNLTVPTTWALGQHTLSAQDARQHSPKQASDILIVDQGKAGTPGPNGSPADDATFTLTVVIQARDAVTGQPKPSTTFTLTVTGHPDPAGGVPCQAQDNGQNQTVVETDPNTGTNYQNTSVWTCSGSYKRGHLEYTETTLTNYAVFLNTGTRCDSQVPFVYVHIVGDFTNATTITGAFNSDAIIDACTNGDNPASNPETGTWTGTIISG
jgi:serine/threonine protein kinase